MSLCAATFQVDSTGDQSDANPGDSLCDVGGGICTLRAAIEEANASAGPDAIEFSIDASTDLGCNAGSGVCVIDVATTGQGFLKIDSQMTIDGSTQTGNADVCLLPISARPDYKIVLNGDRVDTGISLRLGSDQSVLRGLNLRNFFNAVVFEESNNNRLECSYLGTDETGMVSADPAGGNLVTGVIFVCDSQNNIVGGTSPELGNVISASGQDGVRFFGGISCSSPAAVAPDNNAVVGNYIGVAKDGSTPLGHPYSGVSFYGTVADAFVGNSIGVALDGVTHAGNVISSNGTGVYIEGLVTDTRIEANLIGTDSSGVGNLGNLYGGIEIVESSDTTIGAPNAGNVIAFNGGGGVVIYDETTTGVFPVNNRISQNSIFENTGLGIELTEMTSFDFNQDGEDGNDPGDTDTGPNNRQNSPVITDATINGPNIDLVYHLDSPGSFTIEFFIADVDDEEGRVYLGSDTYPGPANTPKSVSIPVGPATLSSLILATATNAAGDTSEFGQETMLPVELQSFSVE